MARQRAGRQDGLPSLVGLVLIAAGAALVLTSLPRWAWMLLLGLLLLWGGLALAVPRR